MSPLALLSLVLMLIGTLVAWLLSRRVTRPLISLTRAAEALSAGDYERRVDVHGMDEVGRLASSFNQMAAEIESARRELMQRVREAQDARHEAERLHEVTEYAREHSERANRAKSDFLAVMSHELRTPLNAIGGYAQLLELGVHGPLTEPQLDALRRIARNQQHLLTLINDLLNYTKLDAGRVTYTIDTVLVSEVFHNIEPLIAPQVQMHQLCFVQDRPDATLAVRADADKLQQILLNLLGNAMKFTPAGGTIALESMRRDGVVQIHVRDTGVGIPADRLEAIFEPFYQGDRALNRPTEGIGLGLAISRDLARGMAGELAVESSIGKGSVFTVVLPVARPRAN
jgi:signal transduction histidine kinase